MKFELPKIYIFDVYFVYIFVKLFLLFKYFINKVVRFRFVVRVFDGGVLSLKQVG